MISNDSNTITRKDGSQVRQGKGRNWQYKQPQSTDEKLAKISSRLQTAESKIRKLQSQLKTLESQMKKEGNHNGNEHSES